MRLLASSLLIPVLGVASCVCPCHKPIPDCSFNPSVKPLTCSGDLILSAEALYWTATGDGLEFATTSNATLTPTPSWCPGARVALSLITCHDGWDFSMQWTYYKGRSKKSRGGELTPLWSDFTPPGGGNLSASKIEADWKLETNLLDLSLGRDFYVSPYVSLRPHVGLRVSWIYQDYDLVQRGGSFGESADRLDLDNQFRGVGLRAGFDGNWRVGCGWSVYGKGAASLVDGRFVVALFEKLDPKEKIFQSEEKFKAVRAMLDFAIGLQWQALLCDGRFALGIHAGWESHLFFNQNQLWRVNRLMENTFIQNRGSVGVEGFVFGVDFHF